MSQSSVIAVSIVIAFFLFITAKGKLPRYLGVFVSSTPTGTTGTQEDAKTDEEAEDDKKGNDAPTLEIPPLDQFRLYR